MDTTVGATEALPLELKRHINAVCNRFEAAWQAAGPGAQPSLEAHLDEVPESARTLLLGELVQLDVHYRSRRGQTPVPGDYLGRFPSLEPTRLAAMLPRSVASPSAAELLALLRCHGLLATAQLDELADSAEARSSDPTALARELLGRGWVTSYQVGQLFQGKGHELALGGYILLDRLGAGGMGSVWLARDQRLDRVVALKELQPRWHGEEQLRQRFLAEARITGRLEHPGIVPVHELVERPGAPPCYTMRLIRGRTLSQAVRHYHDRAAAGAAEALELRELLGAVVSVCNAVAYAHSRGVIHRDLKGANVILGPYGEVQVLDWGVAKVLAEPEPASAESIIPQREGVEATRPGGVVGTFAYMAPEQAQGQAHLVDRRSDVFGLGAILYEVLTGRPPYSGEGIVEQAQTCRPASPRALARGVPAALEAVCLKALARRPEQRYLSAQELGEEVKRWLSGEPVQAYREPWAARVARWLRKHRVLSASVAAAVLVALVLGTAAGVYRQQQRQRAREQAEAGLVQAAQLREGYRYADAEKMLEQVRGWARQAVDSELHRRLTAAEDDLALARDLDRVRQQAVTLVEGQWDPGRVRVQYPKVLAGHGLDALEGDLDRLAQTIRASAVREDIIAALDDWARAEGPTGTGQRLLGLANRADEPDPWRQAVRQAIAQWDEKRLRQLVRRTGQGKPTPALVLSLAAAFSKKSEEPTGLLRRMQLERPRDFWVSFDLGYRLSGQKKAQEAAQCYLVAVALRPDSAVAHNNLGGVLKDKGKLDEAIARYHRAIALDSKYPDAHYNLGNALKAKGKLDQAIACYRQAIAIDPKLAPAHTNLGNALGRKGKVDEAIECYHKAIALDPKLVQAHHNLGIALMDKGKVDQAIACFKRAVAINPKSAGAQNGLGFALATKGKVDEAIECYHKAIALDPKVAKAHNNLGNALRAKGKLDQAIECYEKVIALNPMHGLAHYNLGLALRARGKVDQAIACYQKAIALDPKLAGAHNNLGTALKDKGQLDEAIECFKKAIALDPRDAVAHANLGRVLYAKGKVGEAIESYYKAIALDPKFAEAHSDLGVAMEARGKVDEAIECYHKAIALAPKYAIAHYNLGFALLGKRKLDEAIAAYRETIRLDKEFAEAHCNLGRLLVRQGQFKQGIEVLRRGHQLGSRRADWGYPSQAWVRQAEHMAGLNDRLAAVLEGKDKPRDAADRLGFARLCQWQQRYASAARFYADAFAEQPALAANLQAGHRYHAAWVAARAGCGQGKDAGRLSAADSAGWRRQALTWLRADLVLRSKQLESGPSAQAAQARQALAHWRRDADLAGVRDPEALARLPAAEQAAWRELWAEVEALLAPPPGPK
jgi:tetratricopeptide (TPR) repeat protein